ncbi:hypothetical protein Pgin04_01345 [Porphyromonas gingivalis]
MTITISIDHCPAVRKRLRIEAFVQHISPFVGCGGLPSEGHRLPGYRPLEILYGSEFIATFSGHYNGRSIAGALSLDSEMICLTGLYHIIVTFGDTLSYYIYYAGIGVNDYIVISAGRNIG